MPRMNAAACWLWNATVRAIAGKAIVSVNDIPEMREAFKGFRQRRLKAGVSLNNTGGRAAGKERAELLILNW